MNKYKYIIEYMRKCPTSLALRKNAIQNSIKIPSNPVQMAALKKNKQ